MNVIIFVTFILTVSCSPFLGTAKENRAKTENEVDARRGSHFQGEVYVPMIYGSSSESNPLLLKRTKRKGIRFPKSKPKSPKPAPNSYPRQTPPNSYPRQTPPNSYPRQTPNPGGYPKQPSVNKPGYGYPGYGVPAGGLYGRSGTNPFKQYPKLKYGYGSSGVGRFLSKGGTGRTLGAAMVGGIAGYVVAKAAWKLATLPYKMAMYDAYYQNNRYMGHDGHDHYHDEHGHYLEADGIYYDHHGNRFAHDARVNVPLEARTLLPPPNNVTLMRYYPYNATHGLFEYSNQSTIYNYLEVNSSSHLSVMFSLFFTTLITAMLFNT